MSNSENFVITKAGKLKKYTGNEKNIIIPNGVTEIGSRVFFQSEIESVELPYGLKIIGQEAFGCCFNLKALAIPDSVIKIEPFALPLSLRYIRIPDALVKKVGLAGVKRFFGDSDLFVLENALLSDTNSLSGVLKEKITAKIMRAYDEHAKSAIRFNNITGLQNLLSLMKNVTFEDIDKLISYCNEHKDKATEIKSWLLEYKENNFEREEIIKKSEEQTQKELGIIERNVADWRKIFKFSVKGGKATIKGYISEDENLYIPEMIGSNAVVEIDDRAFSRCSQIKNIVFPGSVERIGNGAFEMCTNRETLTVAPGNALFCSRENCLLDAESKTLIMGCNGSIIPDDGSVKTIGACAFEYCNEIREIKIPDSVTEIKKGAFANCRKLEKLILSENIKILEKAAFSCCFELEKVILPASVAEIGQNAFSSCQKLNEIRISANVTAIGEGAFWNCPNLTIYAPAGSYAETYAKENNIPFVAE